MDPESFFLPRLWRSVVLCVHAALEFTCCLGELIFQHYRILSVTGNFHCFEFHFLTINKGTLVFILVALYIIMFEVTSYRKPVIRSYFSSIS
jgi:hypothetical protein